jgi:phosphoribosylformylglycinamidine cyclo-ligase
VQKLLKRFNAGGLLRESRPIRPGRHAVGATIRAFAHITGGGFIDNIPRVLPRNCNVAIRKGSWDMPPIFRLLQERSGVAEEELYQVFNMGIGMVAVVTADEADGVLRWLRARQQKAWIIGEVVKGQGAVQLV